MVQPPPYNKNLETNIGKILNSCINTHIKHSAQVIKKDTIKTSYSYIENMTELIIEKQSTKNNQQTTWRNKTHL